MEENNNGEIGPHIILDVFKAVISLTLFTNNSLPTPYYVFYFNSKTIKLRAYQSLPDWTAGQSVSQSVSLSD